MSSRQSQSARPSRPGRLRRVTATASLVGVLVAGLALAPSGTAATVEEPEADLGSRFTLAVLPDTQFYSRYATSQFERPDRYGPGNNPFAAQTAWLAEHAEELRIPFVAHLGDVVDQAGVEGEWQVADRAMRTLEDADLPYSVLAGNHDVRNSSDNLPDTGYDLANEPYLRWFSPARAAAQDTYGGSDPTGLSTFHVFEAEGQEFMVLALPWRTSDATLAWADGVMAQHPDVPVILTTHDLLNIEADGVTPRETTNGLRLWDGLIRDNDQIFLTLNGHYHGAASLVKQNAAGHDVTQLVMDHQMAYEGGNGYLGLLEFDLSTDRIRVSTPSPWVVSKPADTLTSFDLAYLEGPNNAFDIEIDFAERFAGFAPDFGPGTADEPSLTRLARDILLDGFTSPDPVTTDLPGATDDYPVADGTLAHWRTDGLSGVLPEGGVVPDVAHGNDLTRATVAESGSTTARPEDVTVTSDAHPFSSSGSAMCFTDSSKVTNRFSYLRTDDDAPVNDAALADGYTIETFLRIDQSFDATENAWMKALVRSGNRSRIGVPQSRWDWTASPSALGLSNLREFQWTEIPVQTAKGDRTSWSGEIILDRWVHVALVNDPATASTTMYVEGAPVLRNATDTVGHGLDAGMPWLFGSDWVDDRATNGWNGCIGETRVVDRPLPSSQWLTSRVDLSDLDVQAPTPTVSRPVAALSGEGRPGSVVTVEGDLSATTTVRADGTWTVPLERRQRPGTYSVDVRQWLGTRASDPVELTWRYGTRG